MIKIAIADDSRLLFSDDYRVGWPWGFQSIGCEVKVFDVAELRKGLQVGGVATAMSMSCVPAAKPMGDTIAQWGADLLFCHHGRAASHPFFLGRMRANGIPTAVYLCDEPYETGETAGYSPRYDMVFTMDPCTIEAHRISRKTRDSVFYLPPGVHTEHFKPTPYFDKSGFELRSLSSLFIGNGTLRPRPGYFDLVHRAVAGAVFHFRARTASKINSKDWIPYEQNPKWYGNCKIGLNVHRAPWIDETCFRDRVLNRPLNFAVPAGLEISKMPPPQGYGTGFWNDSNLPAAHINPRFLEMAACGTLVVSDDHRSELARMFPGTPQASDPDHFLELVLYYLENPEEAEAIGHKCSYLISNRHSYKHRAAEILIRAGLQDRLPEAQLSSLGPPEDWLSPQDWKPQGGRLPLGPTGPSERWSPRFGMSWTRKSMTPSDMQSVDAPTPWLL